MLDRLPTWALKLVVRAAERWPRLGNKLSGITIHRSVNVSRARPHPWSTAHDYISWTSLTDQRFSARHLPAFHAKDLPDPTGVRELFKRPEGRQVLCEKSTCLFPAFAQYLTDGFIRTRMPSEGEPQELRLQNTSNHQIDLCPLYGRLPSQTDALRLKSEQPGKRGRLKSWVDSRGEEYAPFLFDEAGVLKDEFAPLDLPLGISKIADPMQKSKLFAFGGDRTNAVPQVAMINTLLLREHNRLAASLERENPGWDDERLFETARIIVITMFIKLVVEEYINHIAPSPIRIIADATVAQRAYWNKPNWITTEFSLLYRWHSLIPDTLQWNGADVAVAQTFMNNALLLNSGLARAFSDISGQKAGKLGPFNTSDQLLHIEDTAVNQGRLCRLAPYANYREYVGLQPPRRFEDISEDPRVVEILTRLYKRPEDVEFYVGLFSEDTVKNSPLPPLILRMVAADAFSQALTNPLLSEAVHNKDTFTKFGWDEIQRTGRMADLADRNVPNGLGDAFVGMTQPGWSYAW